MTKRALKKLKRTLMAEEAAMIATSHALNLVFKAMDEVKAEEDKEVDEYHEWYVQQYDREEPTLDI